jgi:hypothetical protein
MCAPNLLDQPMRTQQGQLTGYRRRMAALLGFRRIGISEQ